MGSSFAHSRGWAVLLFAAVGLVACRRPPQLGEKIERDAETRVQNARVRAPLGVRERSPVIIALVGEPSGCDRVERARGDTFLACLWPEPGVSTSARLRSTLKDLRGSFPHHVAAAPVSLFAESRQVEEAMNLASEEPSFFAGLALERPERILISNARLFSFAQKGGRRVALLGVPADDVQRARSASSAGHLVVEAFPSDADGLRAALQFARTERGKAPPPNPDFAGSSQGG